MALDLFYTNRLRHSDTGALVYDIANSLAYGVWLDEVGLCTVLRNSVNAEVDKAIVQLDGSTVVRNSTATYLYPYELDYAGGAVSSSVCQDISKPGAAVFAVKSEVRPDGVFIGHWSFYLYEWETRTSTVRLRDGLPARYNAEPIQVPFVVTGTDEVISISDKFELAGVLPDRYLFVRTRNQYPYTAGASLYSFPRSLSQPQVLTLEIVLPVGTFSMYSAALSAAEQGGECWISLAICTTDSNGPMYRVALVRYDYVNRAVKFVTHAPLDVAMDFDVRVDRVWWSRRFKVFVGAGEQSVHLYSLQIVPYAVSAPVLVAGSMQIGKGSTLRVQVQGDVATAIPGATAEPCADVPVTWACAAGGTFGPNPSVSDADGFATTLYYPASGTEGLITITATNVFP